VPLTGEYEPSSRRWVREQVERYEATDGREANTLAGTSRPVVIFTTRGRKSGKIRKFALMRVEHDGSYAMVGSIGGAPKHPGWYFNLKADPEALMVQDGAERFDATARELDGEEREIWWQRAVEAYPTYAKYQEKTERQIQCC
jgi:F420H(2)-dependent quinone reductase